MISANQKGLVILMALVLTFSFSADAAQMKTIKSQSLKRHDMTLTRLLKRQELQAPDDSTATADEDNADNGNDDGSAASPSASPVYKVKDIKEDQSTRATRLKLISNLRKQSNLKEQIAHLTDKTKSDEEIEDAAKLVANETESVEMANMLAGMWKDMRMFDVPAYEKHLKHKLQKLKEDEKVLEAKLKGSDGAAITDKDDDEEEEKDDKEKEQNDDDDEDKLHNVQGVKVGHDDGFWGMSHAKSAFIASIVYLIGGVFFAYIFKQMRSKHFILEASLDGHPNTKGFSFSIFGCLGADLKLCALGFCCPCLVWANTIERRSSAFSSLKASYWQAFLAFFGLMLLEVFLGNLANAFGPMLLGICNLALVLLGVVYRQKMRVSYDIASFESGSKTTVAMDFLLWCFCQPCAIIQEAREETATRNTSDREDGGSMGGSQA